MVYKHETLYNCSDLYAQGTGAKWDNLVYARTGEGFGAYTHLKGSKSKTEYKPKDLCYIYKYNKIDPTKYKVGNVYWTVVFRKYNLKKNNFPKIRIYSGKKGDNTFIREISTYKKLKNKLEYDNYTLQFNLGSLTVAQLKSLIIKVVWDKTKSTQTSEISINRARLSINYLPLRPKFSLFATPNDASITNNDEFIWTLTAKNNGDCGSAESTLVLPTGVTVLSSTSNGKDSYDNSTMKWSYKLCYGESVTRNFRLKFSYVDRYTIRATNDSTYAVNGSVETTVNVEQYYPSPNGELITYTTYPCFAFEDGYFDINIYGVYNGQERHYYDITIPNGITATYPLKNSMIDLGNNSNVLSFPKTGFSKTNRICVQVNDTMANFEAHIRIPYHSSSEADYTVTTSSVDSAKDYTDTLHILEKRGMKLLTAPTITRDKGYVGNSVNIGSPNVWTIRAKASQKNFFDERKDYMSIDIERMIAYIGVIPLSRCHKADVTATSKNSLIENRYLNRAYYGKKGDYDEDIKMTLRMKWQDVATLQGLCEMDKPIPIDTIPTRQDGDPLNHRGWAEIYEVSNIKKINDLYYECDVGVKYLTHKLLTKFGISEKGKITASAIKYYLALTHDYTDDMLDLFRPNYYQNFTSLEDVNGNCVGSYELDAPTTLTLSSIENVNKYSTWDIIFRNHLPSLMSEDFDGNWEMNLRISNHENGESLFEHTYNNFQHYDFDRSVAINSADVTSTFKNGNVYETLNYDKVGLGYDNFSEYLEVGKVATHFNTMETTVIEDYDDSFEIFLLDKQNNGIANQLVKVTVNGDAGFLNTFNVITDLYGRVLFDVYWGNGDYTLTLYFEETEEYESCYYTTDMKVDLNYIEYHFEYPLNPMFVDTTGNFVCTLLNSSNNPVSNTTVHYSFKSFSGDYGHEETATSNVDGQIVIPIKRNSGSQMLKVNFKGYKDGGNIYQAVMFEEQIDVYNTHKDITIESDDLQLVQGDNEKVYSAIVKSNETGSVLNGLPIDFYFYSNDETFKYSSVTDVYGVAKAPVYLKGGAWKVDVVFNGSDTYNPSVISKDIIIDNFKQKDTFIEADMVVLNENAILNGEQEYYSFTLYDENAKGVPTEPINVKIYGSDGVTLYIDTVFNTDEYGKVEVPFITHNEIVFVEIDYKGSVRYNACNKTTYLSFDDIGTKNIQTLSKGTETVLDPTSHEEVEQDIIELRINDVLQNSWISDYTIVHSIDNERLTTDQPIINQLVRENQVIDHNALPRGTYKVTIFKKGNDSTYSICRTFTIETILDGRPSFNYWCSLQDVESNDTEVTYEILDSTGTKYVNDYAHIRFYLNVWIPNGTVARVWNNASTTLATTTTKETTDANGKKITYFDIYCRLRNWATYYVRFEDSIVLKQLNFDDVHIPLTPTSKTSVTVSQTGFCRNYETLQELTIDVAHSDDVITYDNDGYYVIRMVNLETLEELYFYSFIKDNLKPSYISFLLTKAIGDSGDNWQMEILVNDSDTWRCGYLSVTGRITTDTFIGTNNMSLFGNSTMYTQLGDEIDFSPRYASFDFSNLSGGYLGK